MAYRHPLSDRVTSRFDARALAEEVEKQEAQASNAEETRRREEERRQKQLRRAANERPSKVSMETDHAGALLTISRRSAGKLHIRVSFGVLLLGALACLWILSLSVRGGAPFAGVVAFVSCIAGWDIVMRKRKQRPVHVYATWSGFFVLYHRPDAPLCKGRIENLEFDIRRGKEALMKVIPKVSGSRPLGEECCEGLTPSDIDTLKKFARRFEIEAS